MTILAARDAMFDLFRTAWLANPTSAAVALLYDDVQGDQPGFDSTTGAPIPYARLTVQHTEGREETLGGVGVGRDEHRGYFVVQIFTPAGQGRGPGDVLADIAAAAIRRKRFGDTANTTGWFSEVTPREVPSSKAHAQVNIEARFRYGQRA